MRKTNSLPGRLIAIRLRSECYGRDWEFATHSCKDFTPVRIGSNGGNASI